MPLKAFFLILALTLLCVPVLQAAHALTHFAEAPGILETSQADISAEEGEFHADAGFDGDRVCLDCLGLAAFGLMLPVPVIFFSDQTKLLPPLHPRSTLVVPSFFFLYLTRAPPEG